MISQEKRCLKRNTIARMGEKKKYKGILKMLGATREKAS